MARSAGQESSDEFDGSLDGGGPAAVELFGAQIGCREGQNKVSQLLVPAGQSWP